MHQIIKGRKQVLKWDREYKKYFVRCMNEIYWLDSFDRNGEFHYTNCMLKLTRIGSTFAKVDVYEK